MADLTIRGQSVPAPDGSGYTKSQLLDLARWYVDTLGVDYLKDSDALAWDLGQCLDLAYLEYARQTRCFPVILTTSTVAGQALYRYSAFGSGAGSRVFDIGFLSFDSNPLERASEREVSLSNRLWRTAENGLPTMWMPWGDRQIRLWRAPSSVKVLCLEGWETPDLALFTVDSSPDIHQAEQPLLAIYAAILATIRNPNDENLVRQHTLYPQWEAGVSKAAGRISGAGDEVLVFGRYANGSQDTGNFTVATTITNL